MSAILFITFMMIVLICLWAGCVFGPRWFARSLHRHRMWALRDALVDDVIYGRLPRDHDAVRQLVKNMDTTLRLGLDFTLSDALIFSRQLRKIEPSAQRFLMEDKCPLDGLTSQQRALIKKYNENFGLLIVGLLLLGSWFGLICVAGVFLVLAAQRIARQWRSASLGALKGFVGLTAQQATDRVADSSVGQVVSKTLPVLPRDYAPVHASVSHPRQLLSSLRG
jgi:hypothetical protein